MIYFILLSTYTTIMHVSGQGKTLRGKKMEVLESVKGYKNNELKPLREKIEELKPEKKNDKNVNIGDIGDIVYSSLKKIEVEIDTSFEEFGHTLGAADLGEKLLKEVFTSVGLDGAKSIDVGDSFIGRVLSQITGELDKMITYAEKYAKSNDTIALATYSYLNTPADEKLEALFPGLEVLKKQLSSDHTDKKSEMGSQNNEHIRLLERLKTGHQNISAKHGIGMLMQLELIKAPALQEKYMPPPITKKLLSTCQEASLYAMNKLKDSKDYKGKALLIKDIQSEFSHLGIGFINYYSGVSARGECPKIISSLIDKFKDSLQKSIDDALAGPDKADLSAAAYSALSKAITGAYEEANEVAGKMAFTADKEQEIKIANACAKALALTGAAGGATGLCLHKLNIKTPAADLIPITSALILAFAAITKLSSKSKSKELEKFKEEIAKEIAQIGEPSADKSML